MSISKPGLAEERDLARVDALWMSGKKDIRMKPHYTARSNSSERLRFLREDKFQFDLIWVVRDRYGLAGILILDDRPPHLWMQYIVSARRWRGERIIGPALVKKAKTLSQIGFLKAEARNDHSERLLQKLGFESEGVSFPGHFVWRRHDPDHPTLGG